MDKIEFRSEVMENLYGTDNLYSYVKVMPLHIWLVPLGIMLAMAGFVFFRLETGFHVVDIFFGLSE